MKSKKDKSSTFANPLDMDSNKTIIDDGKTKDIELLLDACPYALIIASVDGYITLGLNDEAAKIFKKPKNELIGSTLVPLLELNARERRRQVIHRLINEKKPYLLEDFERGIWWRTYFQPIQNKKGEVTKIAVTIQNISKEKQRERQQIEKNEEFWTRLIEYSNNSFFIIDEKGIIRYASESVNGITGYNSEELVGTNIFQHVYADDIKKAKEFFKKILENELILSFTHRVSGKNGVIRYVESTANNLLNNPIVKGIIITARDITKTHRAEIETQETKRYLENIINSTSEIIFSIDMDTKVTLWNHHASRITGYTSKSIAGKKLFSISLIEDKESFKSYIEQCYKNSCKSYDVKIQTRHGDSKLLRIQGSLVKTDEDEVKGIVFTGKDITSDVQLHGNLITGASYLILQGDNSKAVELLNGLLLNDYHGMVITRDNNSEMFDNSINKFPLRGYYFSQDYLSSTKQLSIVSDPPTLIEIITDFFVKKDKSVVLIDRLDYLIALHGFTAVMQTIYTISSIASKNNGIVLIRLNPAVVSSTELAILKEELKKLPEQNVDNITIDKKLFDILQFVERQNQKKSIVSYKDVRKHFSITKVTTAKRINALSESGLVTIKKKGRLKTIYSTDKGKRLLQKRNVV